MHVWTLALVAWAFASSLFRLGDAPVYIGNEAREGVYARAMLETGNWILPSVPNHVENGEIIPDKPPLFQWIAASSAWLRRAMSTASLPSGIDASRHFDEIDLRMPSLLCSTALIWCIVQRSRRLIGDRAALLAAACTLTSFQFIEQSTYGRVDMALALFVTLTLLLLGEALLEGSRPALLAAAFCSGLAVLSKGPIGFVLPAIGTAPWIAFESVRRRSLRWLFELPWIRFLLIASFLPMIWYVWAWEQGGLAFIRSQLLNENLRQFSGSNGKMATFYYVEPWLTGSFPWNLVALAAILAACRERDRRMLFCAMWWIGFLAFFQIAAYKRGAYLLPALFPGLLLCGSFLDRTLPREGDELREVATRLRLRGWKPIATGALAAFALGSFLSTVPGAAALIPVPLGMIDGGLAFLGLAGAIFGLILAIRGLRSSRPWSALVGLLLFLTCAERIGATSFDRALARQSSPQRLVQRLMGDLPAGSRVTLCGFDNDVSLLPLFYLRDWAQVVVLPFGASLPPDAPPGFYLFSSDAWNGLQAQQATSTPAWHVRWSDELALRPHNVPVILVEKRS